MYAPTVNANVSVSANASGSSAPRGLSMRTLTAGATSAAQCYRNCRPGSYSGAAGLDVPDNPCKLCEEGKSSYFVGATACSACVLGRYTPATGYLECLACEEGSFSGHPGARVCGRCGPGTLSGVAASKCEACPGGTFTPASGTPAAVGCSECGLGEFAAAAASACAQCPAGTTTRVRKAASADQCVSYLDDGVVGHWELRAQGLVVGSSFQRPARRNASDPDSCVETAGLSVEPAAFKDLAQHGMRQQLAPQLRRGADAMMRGPLCAADTEWEAAGRASANMSAGSFLVNNGAWEALQVDRNGVNTGLFVGEVQALVGAGILPTHELAVEVWATVERAPSAHAYGGGRRRMGRGGGGAGGVMGLGGALQEVYINVYTHTYSHCIIHTHTHTHTHTHIRSLTTARDGR